jgi:hypothetical protein
MENRDSLLFDTVLESPQAYTRQISELHLEIKRLEELRFKAILQSAKNATNDQQLESISETLQDEHHFTDEEIGCLFFATGGYAKDYASDALLPEFGEASHDAEMGNYLKVVIKNRSNLVALAILDHLNEFIVKNLYPRREILAEMLEGQNEKIAQTILDRLDTLIPWDHPGYPIDSIRSSILNLVLEKIHDQEVTQTVAVKSKELPDTYYNSIILNAVGKAAKTGDRDLTDRLVKTIEAAQLSELKESLLRRILYLKPDDRIDLETYIKAARPAPSLTTSIKR